MDYKIYRLHGLDSAMHFLRPGAIWEITNSKFTRWEDPRPCPEWSEVLQTMEKLKALEDSINTVWLPEQIESIKNNSENRQQTRVNDIVAKQKYFSDLVKEREGKNDL